MVLVQVPAGPATQPSASRAMRASPQTGAAAEQAPRAPEQLLRGAILTELRRRDPAKRERSGIVARPDGAQGTQRVEAHEMSRGCREIGIASQLLLPVGAVAR